MLLASREAGEGPAVILLHGLFGAGRNLATIQAALAQHHRVVAMDLRNHGTSPHGPDTSYAALAADVAETMDALAIDRAAVFGHSMGGKVAMRLALDQQGRVSRLLVGDIAPATYGGTFARYAIAMAAIPLSPGLTRGAAMAALADTVPDAGLRAFLLQNLSFGAQPAWRIGLAHLHAGLADILSWAPTDARYAGPVLFVAGATSDYIRTEHHAAILALFPHAAFATVPDAGHWLHADNPTGFLAVAAPFLAG